MNSTKPSWLSLPRAAEAQIAVAGLGTTGANIVRYLVDAAAQTSDSPAGLRLFDRDSQAEQRARQLVDGRVPVTTGALLSNPVPEVAVLATPCRTHVALASRLLRSGCHVVSLSDCPDDVTQLLELDDLARSKLRSLVVGAGMAPGLSCLLARLAGDQLDSVDAISISKAGTAGPACARQHHRALKRPGRDWVGQGWQLRAGGSGRDLAWFPEPIGARDCYRGALPSPILLHRQYPNAKRLSARVSATRRDRFTSRLPMLRRPHQDGGPGGVRAEVRGWRDGAVETIVYAAAADPSSAAAVIAVVAAGRVLQGQAPIGATGLAQWPQPNEVLAAVRRLGISISAFTGS